MKIVQAVGWYFPDSLGGTEVYVAALARQLRARGADVAIAAPDPGARTPRRYEHEGCEVFRYPIPASPTREEAQGVVAARGSEYFHRWLAQSGADVAHFHTFVTGLGLFEIAAAKRAGSRVVATTHSSSLGFLCQRGTLMWRGQSLCDGIVTGPRCAACELEHRGAPPAAAAVLSRIPPSLGRTARAVPGRVGTALTMTDLIAVNQQHQRRMLDQVDAFVVLTQRGAEIVLANGAPAAKVVINRLGIAGAPAPHTSSTSEPRSDDHVVRVGYVGRFESVKGVLDLAHALRRVPKHVPVRVEFRGPVQTPGDRVMRESVVQLLADEPRATFADAVPPPAVPDVLRTYDILCCPSRCLEGGPTVGLEALAARVPVIAASVGGVAEVLQDGVNTRLVPPGDIDGLAAALTDVGLNPEGTVRAWRRRLPLPRTMGDVATDYLGLYACASSESSR
jgi:glycosyltransferase involved in cell wall biosynthesis